MFKTRSFKRMHIPYLILWVLLIIASLTIQVKSQAKDDILDLNQLIKSALENNQQLQSYNFATMADSSKISYSGALPDPVISLSLLNLPTNSFSFDQDPMTGKQVALRQAFPFPGKLDLQEKISSQNAILAHTNYLEYENQLIKRIKQLYFDLFYIEKSLEITNNNQLLIGEFTRIAQTKYAVGKGLQHDVLKAQVEFSKLTDKLIELKQKRNELRFNINSIINAPVNSNLDKTIEPEFPVISISTDSLRTLAHNNRPLFTGWTALRKQSEMKVELANKDYWPDFSIYIAYTQREPLQNGIPGQDLLSGGVSFSLPVYSGHKQSKKVEETQFSRNMTEARYNEVQNQVYFDLENTLSSSEKNVKLINLYKNEIIPQAAQSVESALVGYKTDKVDFLTLINSQITLIIYELDYYRALCDYNKDIASLEFLIGKELYR